MSRGTSEETYGVTANSRGIWDRVIDAGVGEINLNPMLAVFQTGGNEISTDFVEAFLNVWGDLRQHTR